MSTSVPTITFADTGITLPAGSDILAGRMADINDAFGGGVNQSLTTPEGQIARSDSAIIEDKNANIAEIVNQVNPDYSSGRWQDGIGRIYFMDRIAAVGTVVTCTCVGLVGTYIPIGSQAQDNSGYIYSSITDGTISSDGTVDIDFQCVTTGPIPCPAGTLTTIYRSIFGWDSVINSAAGTLGVNVESRTDFEFRRKNSVAANAVNSPQSIYANVLAVDGVLDAYVIDNPLGTAVNIGSTNYSVAKNSVYVAVVGGAESDIAAAIWEKKSLGCSYNGNTSYTVYDDNYIEPKPAYVVTWQTPAAVPIYFSVQIENSTSLPGNIVTLIQTAIVSAFNGDDGGTRARIGSTIFAGRYYAPVFNTDSNVNIQSIGIGITSPGASTSVTMGIDQRPTLDASNITVT